MADKPGFSEFIKRLWANKVVRDSSLAALAAVVGAVSVYFTTPLAIVAYVALRAVVATWVGRSDP